MSKPKLPGKCLHEIFEARARMFPDRIAVFHAGRNVTYAELDARANRLACHLQTKGVVPETLVGLCVDRCVEMIVGVLAILKAGGAYVPIDPGYPQERISFLLADSGVSVVLTVPAVRSCLSHYGGSIVDINDQTITDAALATLPMATATRDNLAYLIYTSGSSGTPKGVLIEHRSVVRLFEATEPWFSFSENDVWSAFHSISFDFSVWEIWGALLYGGRIAIVSSDVARSPSQFLEFLEEEQVTILNQTPSAFSHLQAADMAQPAPGKFSLRKIVFGGEMLNPGMLKPWSDRYGLDRPELVNMYGITETTVHATYRPIVESDLGQPEVSPIGIPIPDLQIYLLDEDGHAVGNGMEGRVYVGGAGLARGYHRRPQLDRERFVRKPNAPSGDRRLYDSGDRAQRTPDGDLLYLGRSDDQIKLRGYRVEPREVELCLADHPQISNAVVVRRDYGSADPRLIAFLTVSHDVESVAAEKLKRELASKATATLPKYMVPCEYHFVSTLPLTAHGKIDRHQLLETLRERPVDGGPERGGSGPSRALEQTVSGIVAEMIGKRAALHDDLFDLGATSLTLVRILTAINKECGAALNGSELGDQATVAKLVECVAAKEYQR